MTKFLASLAVIALSWFLTGWLLMVAVGVVHAVWLPQLPTIGFPTALLISLLFTIRGGLAGLGTGLVNVITGDSRG